MSDNTQIHTIRTDAATSELWDVIIIGGGMGGGSAAYSLAHQGFRVLLVEKGRTNFPDASPEDATVVAEHPDRRLRQGRWPTQVRANIDGSDMDMWPSLGCGLGGTSLLYGATLHRLQPNDFEARQTPSGETVAWPFNYRDLEPYYLQAEKIFSVAGTQDPLDTQSTYDLVSPPAMSDCDRNLLQVMRQAKLNPFRIHVAVNYTADCTECGGHFCANQCKGDSRSRCILPALRTGKLAILDQTEVNTIDADDHTAHHISAKRGEDQITLRGRMFILAAGACFTPIVLQRSTNEFWPNGLANHHDLVGRNLMFHASDFIAIWPKGKHSRKGPQKALALRDFYSDGDQRLGELQATGLTAGYGNILYFLQTKFNQGPFKRLSLVRPALRIPAYIGTKLFHEATIFATVVEDHPYADNRIILEKNRYSDMRFEYTIRPEFRDRVKRLRKLLKTSLRSTWVMVLNEGVSLNFGHPCGTCRAGDDATTSVVDRNCRVHQLDNLYVADSSFMPTSGGTNPSLTIAANALRVADIVGQRLEATKTASS